MGDRMKGLIIKDIMCLKKQLMIFTFVIIGVLVVSVMYVLSARFGNIASVGQEMLNMKENHLTEIDVKNLGSMALIMFMLLPIVTVCDMVNVFAADGKAGFFKIAGSFPVSLKKRVLARYMTIYALFGIGMAVDVIIAFVLSLITDMIKFTDFLGIIISAASLMSIYSACSILFCMLLGYGKEMYAQLLSVVSIIIGVLLANFGSVRKAIEKMMAADGEGDISGLWKILDFIKHKSYIMLIAAVIVSVASYVLSYMVAERKRGVI